MDGNSSEVIGEGDSIKDESDLEASDVEFSPYQKINHVQDHDKSHKLIFKPKIIKETKDEYPLFTTKKIFDNDIKNNEEVQNPLLLNKRNLRSTDKKQYNKEFRNKGEDGELKAENNSTFTFEYVGDSVSMKTPSSIIQMPDYKDGNN
jgi:hypothetical protein